MTGISEPNLQGRSELARTRVSLLKKLEKEGVHFSQRAKVSKDPRSWETHHNPRENDYSASLGSLLRREENEKRRRWDATCISEKVR